jgi:hypothetical protein
VISVVPIGFWTNLAEHRWLVPLVTTLTEIKGEGRNGPFIPELVTDNNFNWSSTENEDLTWPMTKNCHN